MLVTEVPRSMGKNFPSRLGGRPGYTSKECQRMIQTITRDTRQQPRRGHTAQSYLQSQWFRLRILVEGKGGGERLQNGQLLRGRAGLT